MPQTGSWETWADSTVVPATLVAGETCTVTITDGMNMSWLVPHASYGGSGGDDDPHGYVNIAALKLLGRGN